MQMTINKINSQLNQTTRKMNNTTNLSVEDQQEFVKDQEYAQGLVFTD